VSHYPKSFNTKDTRGTEQEALSATQHRGAQDGPFIKPGSYLKQAFNKKQANSICPITGLDAPYRDPLTGTPYANKEAFKIIREKFF
jgi:hypothetical protein